MKILIIGDEDLFVEALSSFSTATFSITFAADVDEATRQITSCQPDMVIVARIKDDRLSSLLAHAHEQYGAVRVAVNCDPAGPFEHTIEDAEVSGVLARIEALTGDRSASVTMQDQVAAHGKDLKMLERRVTDVALGTTGGLSEMVVAMDGVQQALKLHMRLIKGLQNHLEKSSTDTAQEKFEAGGLEDVVEAQRGLEGRLTALSEQLASLSELGTQTPSDVTATTEGLEQKIESQLYELRSLERRVTEVVRGTTGGLTELIESTDGVQQALKLHVRWIKDLEKRFDGEAAVRDERLEQLSTQRTEAEQQAREQKALVTDLSKEVTTLRSDVVQMAKEIKALRRDVSMGLSLPTDIPPDLAGDLDMELRMDDEPLPTAPSSKKVPGKGKPL